MNNDEITTTLNPVEAFTAIYNASRPFGLGMLAHIPGDISSEDAAEIVSGARMVGRSLYFDYINGRLMKVWIRLNQDGTMGHVDGFLRDRNYGEGSTERALRAAEATD